MVSAVENTHEPIIDKRSVLSVILQEQIKSRRRQTKKATPIFAGLSSVRIVAGLCGFATNKAQIKTIRLLCLQLLRTVWQRYLFYALYPL